MKELTNQEISELRSLPRSAFEAFVSEVAAEQPDYAEYLYRVARADATRKEVAEFFGVAYDTVDLWKRKGLPYEGVNGVESRYCLADCAKWLAQQKVVKVGNEETEELERELKHEKLKTARLERQKKDGTLVDRDKVFRVVNTVFTLMQSRVALLHKTFGDEVMESWSELLEECIDSFGENFEQIVGDRPVTDDGPDVAAGDTPEAIPDDA